MIEDECPRCGLPKDEQASLLRHINRTLQIAGYERWGRGHWIHEDDLGEVLDTESALGRVEWAAIMKECV